MLSNRRTLASKPSKDKKKLLVTENDIPAIVSARKPVASVQHVQTHAAKTNESYSGSIVYSVSTAGVTNGRRKVLVAKLQDKKYRDAYVRATVTHGIAHQVRVNRELRHLSQQALAERCGGKTTQVAISRIEDPAHGSFTLNTVLKVASALDVAVLVRLVPYSKFLLETADKSVMGLFSKSFDEENLLTKQALITLTLKDSGEQSFKYISMEPSQTSTELRAVAKQTKQADPGYGYALQKSLS